MLLAACGGRTNTTRTSDGADDGTADEGGTDGSGSDGSGADSGDDGGSDTGGDTDGNELLCTVANYEKPPDEFDAITRGCFPLTADGICEPCDLACAESIPTTCGNSGTGLGDMALDSGCYDHLVLCMDIVNGECCHVVTARGSLAIPGRRRCVVPDTAEASERAPELEPAGIASDRVRAELHRTTLARLRDEAQAVLAAAA